MAYLTQCIVCETEVLDDNLCSDCRFILANLALDLYGADRNIVRKDSLYLKQKRMEAQLCRDLLANANCPTCGHMR